MSIFNLKRYIRSFDRLLKNEKILDVIRRHKFIYLMKIAKCTIIFIIIGVFTFVSFMTKIYIIPITGDNVFWIFEISVIVFMSLYFLIRIWATYLDWRYDNLIITNLRVIYVDHHFLFERDVISIHLKNIVNIQAHRKGIIGSILRYGDVNIQTNATTENDCIIHYIPNPSKVVQFIQNEQNMIREKSKRDKEYNAYYSHLAHISNIENKETPTYTKPPIET